jgi:hypothetical protein
MEKAQIIKKRRPVIIITAVSRQDLSEKEIPFLYSAKKKGN